MRLPVLIGKVHLGDGNLEGIRPHWSYMPGGFCRRLTVVSPLRAGFSLQRSDDYVV